MSDRGMATSLDLVLRGTDLDSVEALPNPRVASRMAVRAVIARDARLLMAFSTVVGVVDDSTSRLEIETHRDVAGRVPLLTQVHTVPGTFAFFCGTRAYHRVTPLAAGQRRITFAFTYVREGRRPGGVYEARLKLGNALVYFGLGHLLEGKAARAQ